MFKVRADLSHTGRSEGHEAAGDEAEEKGKGDESRESGHGGPGEGYDACDEAHKDEDVEAGVLSVVFLKATSKEHLPAIFVTQPTWQDTTED